MSLPSNSRPRSPRLATMAGDFSGAFADLGTFLPLVIGMLAVQPLDPAGVLIGFGLFALATAAIYRRPVPVQPMKVVAALVIGGGLGAPGVAATGILLGLVLIALVASGAVGALARRVPEPVMTGVQLGVGLYLAWAGVRLVEGGWALGLAALGVLLALQRTRFKPLAAVSVVILATAWALARGDAAMPDMALGWHAPSWVLPDGEAFATAAQLAVLPQLALTLTNASLITAAIAAELFPHDRESITAGRLALSTGVLNLALAPFGAFPMCHGAGGLVVQHRFGARTGLAPAIFGASCLALGIFLGPGAFDLLSMVPMAAVGALLVIAGVDLAWGKRLGRARGSALFVVLATGLLCVVVNVATGFVLGLLLEAARTFLARRRAMR